MSTSSSASDALSECFGEERPESWFVTSFSDLETSLLPWKVLKGTKERAYFNTTKRKTWFLASVIFPIKLSFSDWQGVEPQANGSTTTKVRQRMEERDVFEERTWFSYT
jgi:hypothetical protein